MSVPKPVRILIPIAVVAAAVGVFLSARTAPSDDSIPRGSVVASGTVEMTEVSVSAKMGGRLAELAADEGDVVRRGQLLARLDTQEMEALLAQAEAAAKAAEARLRDLEKGARPEEIERARAALARAEAAHAGAVDAARTAGESYGAVTELKQQADAAETALQAARAARKQAQARLDLLHAGARPEEIEQARAALSAAKARATLVRKGPRQEEVDEGQAGLAQARAALVNAEATAKRAEALFQAGAMARQQLDDAIAARDRARAVVDAAQARVRALNSGARPEEKDAAEADVRRLEAQVRLLQEGARKEEIAAAEAELQRAAVNEQGAAAALENARRLYRDRFQARGQRESTGAQAEVSARQVEEARAQLALLEAGPTADAVQAARAARDQANAAVAQARTRLQDARIVAPIDGVVAEKVAEQGEVVGAGQSILSLTDPSDTWVKVYLPVARLGKVQIGAPARVRVDAFPGREFEGRVAEVSQVPEFTPKNVQTQEQRTQLVYWVKVAVASSKRELRPGIPADAIFAPEGTGSGR